MPVDMNGPRPIRALGLLMASAARARASRGNRRRPAAASGRRHSVPAKGGASGDQMIFTSR